MKNLEGTTPSGLGGPAEADGAQAADERASLVERIASSPQFRRATKLREFLIYVAEQARQGLGDSVNEQQIGRAVFGRGADYSPSEDNVVRAHARQLRVKLGEYFSTTGKDESLLLEIPKGSYVPVFSPKTIVPAAPPPEPPGPVQAPRASRGIHFWVVLAIAAGSMAATAFLTLQNGALRRQSAIATSSLPSPMPEPLAWIFEPDRPVSIVVADSCFGLMQDLAGRPASLDEYVDSEFWNRMKPPAHASADADRLMRRIRSRQLTSYADILLTAGILRVADPRARVSVRFARDLHPRELNSGNFVFLGSAYSNPWVALYDRKRNFQIQVDAASKWSAIVNKAPRQGERASYVMQGEDGLPGATYGLISFTPSDGAGSVLIIEGTNMEGTEAAGSMILDPRSAREMLAMAGIGERTRPHPAFEILLETKVLAGAPSHTRVVAWRR